VDNDARRRATVATPGEWQCNIRAGAARSGEWAQHFSNASCYRNARMQGLTEGLLSEAFIPGPNKTWLLVV